MFSGCAYPPLHKPALSKASRRAPTARRDKIRLRSTAGAEGYCDDERVVNHGYLVSLLLSQRLHTRSDKAAHRGWVIRAVPLSWSLRSLDRRLCVTTFRWVCLCLNRAGRTLTRSRHTIRVTRFTVRRRK